MKNQTALNWLIPLIVILALVAAGVGLFWQGEGQPIPFTSHRGEAVTLLGHGLYRYDTVSSAAQAQAQDLVTLVLAIPLLVIATWLTWRGSLRGQLLLTGTLGYFLYTYMSMSFLAAYNELFLVYVALFALSLYAFILSMMSFDLAVLSPRFSERLPRRLIAGVLFAAAAFLLLAWLGRIIPPLLQRQTPPLDNTTTMVIQAMDLALIVPLLILAGLLLLRRNAWGYLLASVTVLKMVTLGAAVSVMGVNMWLNGVPTSPVEFSIFPTLTLINAVMAVLLLRSVNEPAETPRSFSTPTALPKGAR